MDFKTFSELWENPQVSFFELTTSGTTGEPKVIKLYKDKLIISALMTQKALNLNQSHKILCCIPTTKTGGFMQWVRAKVLDIPIETIEPSTNPMLDIEWNHNFKLTSLVPLQLFQILQHEPSFEKLKRFEKVLIGGSALNKELLRVLQNLETEFYLTYGMTETYSHIALQKINSIKKQDKLYPLKGIFLSLSGSGCLIVASPFSEKPLLTHDVAKLFKDGGFEILGRSDFVINSGGIKIIPEQIEKIISENGLLPLGTFVISEMPDLTLGSKVVLVSQSIEPPFLLEKIKELLPKNHHPKEWIQMQIPLTETGKVKRAEILRLLQNKTP